MRLPVHVFLTGAQFAIHISSLCSSPFCFCDNCLIEKRHLNRPEHIQKTRRVRLSSVTCWTQDGVVYLIFYKVCVLIVCVCVCWLHVWEKGYSKGSLSFIVLLGETFAPLLQCKIRRGLLIVPDALAEAWHGNIEMPAGFPTATTCIWTAYRMWFGCIQTMLATFK